MVGRLTDGEVLEQLADAARLEHKRLSGHDSMYGGDYGCASCQCIHAAFRELQERRLEKQNSDV